MFFLRQINQIKKGGKVVLYKKTIRLVCSLCEILFSLLLLPLIIILRLISPFILIRFSELISSRIGHYAANTELYMCERDIGIQPNNAI